MSWKPHTKRSGVTTAEFFWVDGYRYETTKDATVFTPTYSMTQDEKGWYATQIKNDVAEVTAKLRGNDYDKVKALYEYLVKK